MRIVARALISALSRALRPGRAVCAVTTWFLAGALALSAPADPPSAIDARLKLRVRELFRQDTMLGSLNLFVDVERGIATLAGDVPSEATARYAVELVGRVTGIVEVRSQLGVRPQDGVAEGPRAFHGPPTEPARTKQAPQKQSFTGPETPSGPSLAGAVSLGAPVPLEPPKTSAASALVGLPVAPLPAPGPAPTAAPDLASLVEAERRRNARYRGVAVDVAQGTVSLRGVVERWEDVEELARIVRRLPGVRKVVIDNVRAEGR